MVATGEQPVLAYVTPIARDVARRARRLGLVALFLTILSLLVAVAAILVTNDPYDSRRSSASIGAVLLLLFLGGLIWLAGFVCSVLGTVLGGLCLGPATGILLLDICLMCGGAVFYFLI